MRLLLPLLLLISAKCPAQSDSTHSLLWKITGKDLKEPSYVFGTMHVMCADSAVVGDTLKALIPRVDKTYFECEVSDMNTLMNNLKFMRMSGNQQLKDLLDSVDYKKVVDFFDKYPPVLPFGMLEKMKPLLVSSLVEETSMECKVTDGMERLILRESAECCYPPTGLETLEQQAALFDSIPYATQAKELVRCVDSAASDAKLTTIITGYYMAQDLDRLGGWDSTMVPYEDLLINNRNRKWVKQLLPEMVSKSLLIAVGVGNLPGDRGLLNLFRKQGYTVTPVSNDIRPKKK